MPLLQLYLSKEENDKIQFLMELWKLSKQDAIKNIILLFKVEDYKK